MATATTYAGLTYEQRTYYETELLITALPNLVHAAFGQKHRGISIPNKQGMTVDWRFQ